MKCRAASSLLPSSPTEAPGHIIIEAERHLCQFSCHTICSEKGQLDYVAQGHVQACFEYLSGCRFNLSGQPVPVCDHPKKHSQVSDVYCKFWDTEFPETQKITDISMVYIESAAIKGLMLPGQGQVVVQQSKNCLSSFLRQSKLLAWGFIDLKTQITESQNHQCWKILTRSSSPTVHSPPIVLTKPCYST